MCLVFVSLNEHGVRSGIPAHASVRRPEVESGIHLVCLVFIGGSRQSDKGVWGGGGRSSLDPPLVLVSLIKCTPIELVCLWWIVEFFLTLLPQRQNVFFSRAKIQCMSSPSYRTPQCSPQLLNCKRWEPAAQASLSLPNLSNTSAEGSAASRTLVNFFRLLQTWASSARSGELLCWFCYTL